MSEPTLDQDILASWIGKQEEQADVIESRTARLMQATLDRDQTLQSGDALPPLWHWLYFPIVLPQKDLGRDGHPKLGGFLPPVALPRRMWAGGRFGFERALRIGEAVQKRSAIKDVRIKEGRSGSLCFVTVRHEFTAGDAFCFWEEHDIVYREDPAPGAPMPVPPDAPGDFDWQRRVEPSAIMLFRYSALTFNGHRIHYDREYSKAVEGYPGLVFHGPLTATLLFDLLLEQNPGRWVSAYEFQAVSPLFDTEAFTIAGQHQGSFTELWAANPEDRLAMTAKAELV
ncbi:MaoC family dehydratase N-terminal domain-containing protein [Pelagibius sp. Alg239-R121]|uniref:FAS1-like dehydratase domain-containing protein n=1 Tax=Pelagibius sp. Alg239-R121 TaxID=2993448 RepID=UPI0024A7A3EA|nr:MaoC family dehydratase N-terminal domain-containing protein [Pelagibius sp. Alg239-R121]